MDNNTELRKRLEKNVRDAALFRPVHIGQYEAGTELVYDVTEVNVHKSQCKVKLVIEKFVGGGFAGQVYKVKILDIENDIDDISALKPDNTYAMKILIPPTRFANLFRNVLYWIGFQGPFQLQVNPMAARSGALWQKFIRRGARLRFTDEEAVVDIYATFVDNTLGSCGELSEWIDGRTWLLEVDDHMDWLSRWIKGKKVPGGSLGSPEYRSKRVFMQEFVRLLHDMGCHEFARQYEWSTCKSQPNCLKRTANEGDPAKGLVAVDFRAGLALLPFLPMSPGDFKLIAKGIARGSLVQFDRGDVEALEVFVDKHKDGFADMGPMLEELRKTEAIYRDSVPDITHNHVRLLYSKRLWSTILNSARAGWKVRNLTDKDSEKRLRSSTPLALLFLMIGLIPFLGDFFRKLWARADWRKHYFNLIADWNYFKRAAKAKAGEMLIAWHRCGRIDDERAMKLSMCLWPFFYHIPLSILPVWLHKFLTDPEYAKRRLVYLIVRPVRLYFRSELREEWLREMVKEGGKKNLLSSEDAEVILAQIHEPFIQKYLKSLAVHLCTLPVTQIVSLTVAIIYVLMHPEMPKTHSWGIGLGIIALFQVVPISPGSLTRGFYVLYLVIKERNFRDYNIAVFLGFFKYVGYLAFPIQMAYRYPALARFMAGHWATEAVHIVPVFGESGALLEHGIFSLFYNWPLTIRRRMRKRTQIRTHKPPRYWPIFLYTLLGSAAFSVVDLMFLRELGRLPGLMEIWWLSVLLPALLGALVTISAGGALLGKRIISAALCGCATGLSCTALTAAISLSRPIWISSMVVHGVWRIFIFTIFAIIGAIVTELKLPDPDL